MNGHHIQPEIRALHYLIFLSQTVTAQSETGEIKEEASFSFIVAADMRQYAAPRYRNSDFFWGPDFSATRKR